MLLPLALLLLPPAGRRALAPPAVRATMQARYTRGEDGGGTVDEQRVQELIARRGELRRMRNFKGADGMLDQLAVKPEHRTFASLSLAEAVVAAGTPVDKPSG